jgi:hypothetical protein
MENSQIESDAPDNEDLETIEDLLPLYDISNWGADYTVEVIVGRLRKDDIFIPPFQRKFVWNQVAASRFIESLIFGLPVPGVFLSKDSDTNRMLVIDGQQRLTSLMYFYDGVFKPNGREFALKNVHNELEGKTYKTLPIELRRRLDDSIIHATIVKQESPSDDGSSIYQIFERLNTGGKKLTPQEIRSAVYYGDLVQLLGKLNSNSIWRSIYGNESKDMKDQEYILRFLAMHDNHTNYRRPMTHFLNKFLGANKTLTTTNAAKLEDLFVQCVDLFHTAIGEKVFRPTGRLNLAIFDAAMVGLAKRLENKKPIDNTKLLSTYNILMKNADFLEATKPNTSDNSKVEIRMKLAVSMFAGI